jgi:ribosome-binding ATPase YchF (GTP1/OBG family)
MWIVQILKRDWLKIARTVESSQTDLFSGLEERLSGLSINRRHILAALHKTGLNAEKPTAWSNEEFIGFVDTLRAVSKPMLIAANKIDVPPAEENVERLKETGYTVVPCCAEAELALRRAAEKELIRYLPGDRDFEVAGTANIADRQRKALEIVRDKVLKFRATGVQEAINTAFFGLLNMIVVYTVEDAERLSDHNGRVLPDARLVPKGTTAKELAYVIHTDLGDNFIHAVDVKSKMRRGEDHVLKDRDVISIVSAKKRA